MHYREAAYALLRATMGVIFLVFGINKFISGVGGFVGVMNQQFSGKLPAFMVMPFAYVLPFGEVFGGVLILLGLFTRVGLIISGLLLVGLTFGMVILGQAPTVAHNLQYALLNFVLLWFSDLNGYSLDRLIHRKSPAVSQQ